MSKRGGMELRASGKWRVQKMDKYHQYTSNKNGEHAIDKKGLHITTQC